MPHLPRPRLRAPRPRLPWRHHPGPADARAHPPLEHAQPESWASPTGLKARDPWHARVRAAAGRQAAIIAGALILLVAAGASVAVPLGGAGCPSAQAALRATATPLPGGTPPARYQGVVDADAAAVDRAQGATNDAHAALVGAQKQVQDAAGLQNQADQAQSATYTSTSDSASYTVESDQSTVNSDADAVQQAKDSLKSAQAALASAKQDVAAYPGMGLDTSYEEQAVTDAQQQVNQAQATLATDQSKLATDKKAADSAAAAATSAQARADALAQQAKDAQAKANSALTTAQALAAQATTALSAAQDSQTQHEQADAAADAMWHHQHRLAVANVRAANTAASDCRVPATRNAAVGASLAASALLLLPIAGRARRRTDTMQTRIPSTRGPEPVPLVSTWRRVLAAIRRHRLSTTRGSRGH